MMRTVEENVNFSLSYVELVTKTLLELDSSCLALRRKRVLLLQLLK